jgi:16S rRNA (cytidine1402-2'-O)-methyltransferase
MNEQNLEKGKLFLIPNVLSESEISNVIPAYNLEIINSIFYYIVENVRTARRFLSKCKIATKIDDLHFSILDQHTNAIEYNQFIQPALQGKHLGIISEAGCPAIADPGAEIVKLAHLNNIDVVPLVGPTSIILALMASGFNGQSFSFNGYLPVKPEERANRIRKDEQRSRNEHQTQIYIETPYRNNHLIEAFISVLNPETKLCIAVNLNSDLEFIKTKPIKQWKGVVPDLNKKPAIFLFYAS